MRDERSKTRDLSESKPMKGMKRKEKKHEF